MSPERVGSLILQLQADAARPRDLREFLQELINNPEMRRTIGLANNFSGLDEVTRHKHCTAMTLFMLSMRELVPPVDNRGHPYDARGSFTLDFPHARSGPWKDHVKMLRDQVVRSNPAETFMLSPVLRDMMVAIQDFWGMPDKYVC